MSTYITTRQPKSFFVYLTLNEFKFTLEYHRAESSKLMRIALVYKFTFFRRDCI